MRRRKNTEWDHLKIGDVVRFSRFSMAEDSYPLWGIVTKVASAHGHPEITVLRFGAPSEAFDNDEFGDPLDWPVHPSDTGHVVPEDEVPDGVWVEIAKDALLGRNQCE